jgi:hypothetical protein
MCAEELFEMIRHHYRLIVRMANDAVRVYRFPHEEEFRYSYLVVIGKYIYDVMAESWTDALEDARKCVPKVISSSKF